MIIVIHVVIKVYFISSYVVFLFVLLLFVSKMYSLTYCYVCVRGHCQYFNFSCSSICLAYCLRVTANALLSLVGPPHCFYLLLRVLRYEKING